MIGRLLDAKLRINPRSLGVLAVAYQMRRLLLFVDGRLRRLHQGASADNERYRECRAKREPWTSRDRCHTLPLLNHRYRQGL
jgi:hypothetical protein